MSERNRGKDLQGKGGKVERESERAKRKEKERKGRSGVRKKGKEMAEEESTGRSAVHVFFLCIPWYRCKTVYPGLREVQNPTHPVWIPGYTGFKKFVLWYGLVPEYCFRNGQKSLHGSER